MRNVSLGLIVLSTPTPYLVHVKNSSLSRFLRLVSVAFFAVLLRLVSITPFLLHARLVSETCFLLLLRLVSEIFFCFY